MKGVLLLGRFVILGNVNGGDESVDGLGSVGDGTVAEVLVHDFTTAHTDVFVGLKSVSNVDLVVGGGDEFHAANLKEGRQLLLLVRDV